MRKLISFLFISILAVSAFALPACADTLTLPAYNASITPVQFNAADDRHPIDLNISDTFGLHNGTYNYYFAYMKDNNTAVLVKSQFAQLVYVEERNSLKFPNNSLGNFAVYTIYCTNDAYSVDNTEYYTDEVLLPNGFDTQLLYGYTNMQFGNVFNFDPLTPPDVFTYSIDRQGATLQNGNAGLVNLTITFTPEYLNYVESVKEVCDPSFTGKYSFMVYTSNTHVTDLETLCTSLQNMSYVYLNYTDIQDFAHSQILGDNTLLRGATNVFAVDPLQNSSFTIPVYTENIKGTQTHETGYFYVIASHETDNLNPDLFGSDKLNTSLERDTVFDPSNNIPAPNNNTTTYPSFSSDVGGIAGAVFHAVYPEYKMRTYYFPYQSVNSCTFDSFQGSCEYKLQTFNGQDYISKLSVDDYTSSNFVPDYKKHSSSDAWMTPEDYARYYEDWKRQQQYGDYDFNATTLKDVFDKEGDFFSFMGSAFSVFPSYIMSIFIGFLVALLTICLLKLIL